MPPWLSAAQLVPLSRGPQRQLRDGRLGVPGGGVHKGQQLLPQALGGAAVEALPAVFQDRLQAVTFFGHHQGQVEGGGALTPGQGLELQATEVEAAAAPAEDERRQPRAPPPRRLL